MGTWYSTEIDRRGWTRDGVLWAGLLVSFREKLYRRSCWRLVQVRCAFSLVLDTRAACCMYVFSFASSLQGYLILYIYLYWSDIFLHTIDNWPCSIGDYLTSIGSCMLNIPSVMFLSFLVTSLPFPIWSTSFMQFITLSTHRTSEYSRHEGL